jgi:hypothetical protein
MAELQSPEVAVQRTMNLVMPLKDPSAQGKANLVIAMASHRDAIDSGLNAVGNVHFARFSLIEGSLLMISTYDGSAEGYVREFARVLGDVFDDIMTHIADWPPVPFGPGDGFSVRRYPDEFVEWVLEHDLLQMARDPAALFPPPVTENQLADGIAQSAEDRLRGLLTRRRYVNLSVYRGYPGYSVAQIRDALGLGW